MADKGPFNLQHSSALLGLAARAKQQIEQCEGQEIGPQGAPALRDFLTELINWTQPLPTEALPPPLRDDNTTVRNFLQYKHLMPISMARELLNEAAEYVLENATVDLPPESPAESQPRLFAIRAIEWRTVVHSDVLQQKIGKVAESVDDALHHLSQTNLLDEQGALGKMQRAQLIAVLETALNILKSPMIEKNLLKKAAAMLRGAAAAAIEKQVESTFAFAAGFAAAKIGELLPHL